MIKLWIQNYLALQIDIFEDQPGRLFRISLIGTTMAVILDAFFGAVVDKITALVEEEVVMLLGVKDELKRLQRKMKVIKSVLCDAERKRIRSDLIADWVSNLKDVLYEADDIIDLCRCEGAALLVDHASSSSVPPPACCSFPSFVSCFRSVPFRHEIGNRIDELNQRFKDINDGVRDLNLLPNQPDIAQCTRVNPRQTSSVAEIDVVGEDIENATRDLVQLMTQEDGDEHRGCQVIAVVGMGGIGKTTLAQSIFNHTQIQSEFSKKIWVCISQNFSESNLLAEIIKEAGGSTGGATTKAQLLPLLRDAVSGKRFFLVLDDVWRADVWVDLLRNPLQSGAIGSQVLVTTRDRNVARGMGTRHIHPVGKLSTESGWRLLCMRLFADSQDEEMQRLRDIGIQIVEECDGLPLAIKAIAGVLISRDKSETEWKRVMRSDLWSIDQLPEDFRGALYLSYENLPPELKQCFLFCSLFREDYQFYHEDIVDYWIVEGFVDMKGECFLEIAYDHLEELYKRNLIERVSGMYYKMHDVLRSMAQFLSRNESFCGRADELAAVPLMTKLRRLRIIDRNVLEAFPGLLLQHKSLRTLFFEACPRSGLSQVVVLPFLRLLMLSGSDVEDVPEAIGDLIHLRLLDLVRTKISSLPESIKNLTNLHVLNLSECHSLHTLPKAITKLRNLWHLKLNYTPLQFIPAGIGRLSRLNVLDNFIVGEDLDEQQGQGCRLEELKPLKQLRLLCMEHLERAAVGSVERGEQQLLLLRDKQHLKHLELRCGQAHDITSEEEMHKIEKVLTQLAPPLGLETLQIDGYFGRSFPNWMMSSSSLGSFLGQLTVLVINNCRNIQELPPLGTLPQLRSLVITRACGVVRMGREFLGCNATSSSTTVFFPRLEVVWIVDMPNLEEWSVFAGEEEEFDLVVFPNLHSLIIKNCPKLEHLPSALKQSSMKMLVVEKCQSLERISDLPAVRELRISSGWDANAMACPSLKCVENLDGLRKLVLEDPVMESLPEWLRGLLQQRQQRPGQQEDDDFSFELECDEELLKRCLEGCEYWPIIQDIPRVYVATNTWGDKYMKYTKRSLSYETNL